jgi:thiamine pyrophosphate-dependent acetolactate synthase large subunit-like protein
VAKSKAEVKKAFLAALGADSPMVITVSIKPEIHHLVDKALKECTKQKGHSNGIQDN